MQRLSPYHHAIFDYLLAGLLLLVPGLFDTGPTWLSLALAGIFLLLALTTKSLLGIMQWIPLKVHELIEAGIGILLVALTIFVRPFSDAPSSTFFQGVGVMILVVSLMTNHSMEQSRNHGRQNERE